jgi:hypothetical protein
MTASCMLYLTYYSEYLVRGEVCVGVRDRRSGSWQPMHVAARAYVLGPQATLHSSPLIGDGPRLGERLCLRTAACRIVTGPIIAVETPSRRLVVEADQQWQAMHAALDPQRTAVDADVESAMAHTQPAPVAHRGRTP